MIKTGRTRVTQACEHCRSLKLKCTSGNPCNRCKNSNIQCFYTVNRPKPKPILSRPKFHRLQTKQKILEETFERVQTLLKLHNIQQDSSSENFELYFEPTSKAHQFFRTPSSSPKSQEFPKNLTCEFLNSKETSLVAPTMKRAQHEFYQKLVDTYLNYNYHNFPMLLKKDLYQLLDREDHNNSIVLTGVFATSLKLFCCKNTSNSIFNNPFYDKLKGMIKNHKNVFELGYIKACMLAAGLEMGTGLYFQSFASNSIVARLGLTSGFDKISNSFNYFNDKKYFDIFLLWLNSISFDRLQSSNMGTPTIVPIESVTVPLTLPNISSPEDELNIDDLDERANLIYYIQAISIYCMATTMYQMSKLHRQLKSSEPKDYSQITSDFDSIYERIESYSNSSLFYSSNYQLTKFDLQNKNLMYAKFIRTNMFMVCFVKFGQLLQDYYYYYYIPSLSNPLELTITGGPLSKLHYFQNQSQLMAMNFCKMVNQLKSNDSWLQSKHIIYFSSLSIAFTTASLCQFLVTDLSLLGKTLFKFCYEELKLMSEIWPMVNRWVTLLEKHYESITV